MFLFFYFYDNCQLILDIIVFTKKNSAVCHLSQRCAQAKRKNVFLGKYLYVFSCFLANRVDAINCATGNPAKVKSHFPRTLKAHVANGLLTTIYRDFLQLPCSVVCARCAQLSLKMKRLKVDVQADGSVAFRRQFRAKRSSAAVQLHIGHPHCDTTNQRYIIYIILEICRIFEMSWIPTDRVQQLNCEHKSGGKRVMSSCIVRKNISLNFV